MLAIDDQLTCKGGLLGNTCNFLGKLGNFFLQGLAVGCRVGAVGGLNSQHTDALEHVGGFIQGTFNSLGKGNAVVGVAVALVQAINLGGQSVADLKTCCVVLGGVDTKAGRKPLIACI